MKVYCKLNSYRIEISFYCRKVFLSKLMAILNLVKQVIFSQVKYDFSVLLARLDEPVSGQYHRFYVKKTVSLAWKQRWLHSSICTRPWFCKKATLQVIYRYSLWRGKLLFKFIFFGGEIIGVRWPILGKEKISK